ncbi:methylmalonyl Co-A mutase-associated GTPase MeaB [Cytobacillus purgationiresistens]|uniref:LAO/AO transport system kinase n=1 Tax=Cytobacillus purgationiresistens TaxID=863449 RepID=A0ABU0ADP5_9BACI|nr:methylmalonyl Co-A mutase-associated GTPase MeaB [Cytobacillus purgationiresistens]MDQ0269369.1 LAO/AO transport system kinase [Cytobacillus purgationiresistens]
MAPFKKPEWHQNERNSDEFTTSVVSGVHAEPSMPQSKKGRFQKRNPSIPDIEQLEQDLLKGERSALARSITLIESNAEHHFRPAQVLLHKLLSHSGKSIRIGITGVPGAGKSTFIETFGTYLCDDLGLNVAVLAVDPSSKVSGGSILGDKTRMEQLSRNPRAFIRPSPSSGKLGGVHRKTRETMLLCEAAGFDVILVETVGVGQSEVIVRDMVDFFMLLALTGAGDELQGMKKGIMELADTVIVNKADGANKQMALRTKAEYDKILHFLQPATKGWGSRAFTCSAMYNEGIADIWQVIEKFTEVTQQSGVFEERRRLQTKEWIYSMIMDQLQFSFFQQPEIKVMLPKIENDVIAGDRTVTSAVEELFSLYSKQ